MARAPTRPAAGPKSAPSKTTTSLKAESRAVVSWDQRLAEEAQAAAKLEEGVGGGQFVSARGGQLTVDGESIPGNEMAVVVLDVVLEHVYYSGDFDPETPAPPDCFAFGRTEDDDLVPHKTVSERGQAVNPTCDGCPMGEWGSAPRGKGKACRWTRRLALIPAGTMFKGQFEPEDDPDHYRKAEVRYLKLPVTSVKLWAGWVKQVSGVLKRPPHGVFAKLMVRPDPKNQHRIEWEVIDNVPDALLPAIMARRDDHVAGGFTEFPYNLDASEPARPAKAAKPAARRKY
jgi:hypothetical protein